MTAKGTCPKHGEFVLIEGCQGCLVEKRGEPMKVKLETKKQERGPDYSQSAENLCNPPELKELMAEYQSKLNGLDAAKAKIPEDIMNQCIEAEAEVKRVHEQVKEAIDNYGSYQDLEAGVYAIKYRRMIKSYHVEPFKRRYEKFVPAVVEETINVKALEGLVKGGLISGDDLKRPEVGVITETPTYAYFIR